jgi:transcriptional regulator with XRE-family HTH domain
MTAKIDPMDAHRVRDRFAGNFVRARRHLLMSQEDLGFRACLHRTEIGMLERGIRLPRIDTFLKLAGALESSPNELLDGIVWVPQAPLVGSFVIAVPIESARNEGSDRGRPWRS